MIILKQYGLLVNQPDSVRIVACARLHLGLISMHAGGPRKNGGIGFSIESPTAVVDVHRSDRLTISDERTKQLLRSESDQLIHDVELVIQENKLKPGKITISGAIQTHVGLGSGTAMRLAILEALFSLNDLPYSRGKLIRQSRRGGTSGVGTASYFGGGMVLDLGRLSDGLPSAPSSQSNQNLTPTATLPILKMPPWPLCVCVPTSISPKTQQEEVDFFERVLPLEREDSYRSCYEAVFGVYGSIKERDYSSFCRAVNSIQTTAWKALEWNEYGSVLQSLRGELERFGVDCVGMSSLGPSLFCFASANVLDQLVAAQSSISCEVTRTRPSNMGRTLFRRFA